MFVKLQFLLIAVHTEIVATTAGVLAQQMSTKPST